MRQPRELPTQLPGQCQLRTSWHNCKDVGPISHREERVTTTQHSQHLAQQTTRTRGVHTPRSAGRSSPATASSARPQAASPHTPCAMAATEPSQAYDYFT